MTRCASAAVIEPEEGEVAGRTAQRVQEIIDKLGYEPSARAVGLARGRTSTVGMLVPSLVSQG